MFSENQDKPCLFEKVFYNILNETMGAGDGGVFGTSSGMGHGGDVGSSDFYAPGDARLPKIIGSSKRKKRKSSKKRKKKSKKSKKMEEDSIQQAGGPVSLGGRAAISVQRRSFPEMIGE